MAFDPPFVPVVFDPPFAPAAFDPPFAFRPTPQPPHFAPRPAPAVAALPPAQTLQPLPSPAALFNARSTATPARPTAARTSHPVHRNSVAFTPARAAASASAAASSAAASSGSSGASAATRTPTPVRAAGGGAAGDAARAPASTLSGGTGSVGSASAAASTAHGASQKSSVAASPRQPHDLPAPIIPLRDILGCPCLLATAQTAGYLPDVRITKSAPAGGRGRRGGSRTVSFSLEMPDGMFRFYACAKNDAPKSAQTLVESIGKLKGKEGKGVAMRLGTGAEGSPIAAQWLEYEDYSVQYKLDTAMFAEVPDALMVSCPTTVNRGSSSTLKLSSTSLSWATCQPMGRPWCPSASLSPT